MVIMKSSRVNRRKNILACPQKRILFRNETYCNTCKGCNGEYLQNYREDDKESLQKQGYVWVKC